MSIEWCNAKHNQHFQINEEEVFDKALALYAEARKRDPDNFDLAEDIAQTYYGIRTPAPPYRMARTDDALKAWDLALQVAPGAPLPPRPLRGSTC